MQSNLSLEATPDGYRWSIGRHIDASPSEVWDVFIDTERWPAWGPSITAVETEQRQIESGTTGRVWTVAGIRLPFTIISVDDHRWTWRIGPIRATGHRVEAEGEGCRAFFEVPLWAVPYIPVCALALARIDRIVAQRS